MCLDQDLLDLSKSFWIWVNWNLSPVTETYWYHFFKYWFLFAFWSPEMWSCCSSSRSCLSLGLSNKFSKPSFSSLIFFFIMCNLQNLLSFYMKSCIFSFLDFLICCKLCLFFIFSKLLFLQTHYIYLFNIQCVNKTWIFSKSDSAICCFTSFGGEEVGRGKNILQCLLFWTFFEDRD